MKWISRIAVISFFATVFSTSAFAVGTSNGVLLNLNAYLYNIDQKTSTAESKSSTSIYDIKLGYLSGSGLYLGAIHTSRSVSGDTSKSGSATGASIGYIGSSGFFLQGHYLISAEYDSWKEGSGFQGDFGYLTNVTTSFMVGVELTYRSLTYKDGPSVGEYEVIETFPMLTVGFVF